MPYLEVHQYISLSDVEAEVHDVAVLHNIILTFDRDLASLAAFGFATEGHIVVELDNLGPDETSLKVAVDDAGGLGPSFLCGKSRRDIPWDPLSRRSGGSANGRPP